MSITLAQAVLALKADPLNNPDCSCMEHYCACEHQGFAHALEILEFLVSQ